MANLTITNARPVAVTKQRTGPAAEAIASGQAVRYDVSAGKLTKANASSAAEARILGIAVTAATATGTAPVTVMQEGLLDVGNALSALAYDANVYLSATDGALADANPATNEVQTVTITGSPTGGDFTLTFDGQTTAPIAYNADGAAVDAALEALSNIGAGDVGVTGSAGGPYTVTFTGALAGTNVPALTADAAGLTGGTTPAVAVTTGTPGVHAQIVGRVVPAHGYQTTADKLLEVRL